MKAIQLLIMLLTSCLSSSFSQTVVNMKMPVQATEALEVVALFDEALPLDIPVVLGIIGFGIKGGTNPYTYAWLRNDSIIGTGNTIVITPKAGSAYSLRVTDKNKCVINNSLNLSTIKKAPAYNRIEELKIYPTMVSDHINIEFLEFVPENTQVKIYDMKGVLHLQQIITGSTTIYPKLMQGEYFVVIENVGKYSVQKIIVTNN
ncbi:MAG TPA: T9SS type A sorting domain-containing protein [Paludibacter sp.]|nr:T9SS type A sorting domain-containing protein [Paludibacter sp.]